MTSVREQLKKNKWLVRRYRELLIWKQKHFLEYAFVHINKTGGGSVRLALGWLGGHTPARQRRKEYGEKLWDQKFTFAFVRNPYDRLVSQFHYRVKTRQDDLAENPLSFAQWVEKFYGPDADRNRTEQLFFLTQTDWIYDKDGQSLVKYIGRFETLRSDFEEICRRIERTAAPLPHVNKSDHKSYQAYYDDKTYEIATKVFQDDLRNFNYKF